MATLPVYPRALYSLYLPLIMKIKVDACRRRAAKAKKKYGNSPQGCKTLPSSLSSSSSSSSFIFIFYASSYFIFCCFLLHFSVGKSGH